MATSRRGFLRGLLASVAVAPLAAQATPVIVRGFAGIPNEDFVAHTFEFYTSHFRWDVRDIEKDWREVARITILDELPDDLPVGTQVRLKLLPPAGMQFDNL